MNQDNLLPAHGYSDSPQGKICPPVQMGAGAFSLDDKPPTGYGFIYKITSPSGKSYIGQTTSSVNHRLGQHRVGHCPYLKNAIRKYGIENLSVSIIAFLPISFLSEREIIEISSQNTLHPNGYNLSSGGERPIFHAETRKKISDIRMGMKFTREHIKNNVDAHKAVYKTNKYKTRRSEIAKKMWADPQIAKKMCAGRKGRKHSEETKKKISESSAARIFSAESCRKRSIAMRAIWSNPLYKDRLSKAMRSSTKRKNNRQLELSL